MSGIPFRSHLATRQVQKLGTAATLTTWTSSSQDSHGDEEYVPLVIYPLTVVLSFVTNTREPFDRHNELGHYDNMHVEFFTTDPLPTDIGNPVDKNATLAHSGYDYEITDIEVAQNGLSRLIGYRKRV